MSSDTNVNGTREYSRREFVRDTAAFVAGAALVPNLLHAQQAPVRKSGKKIRMGVVGGGFGTSFYWNEDPNCIVEAVSDLRADRRQALVDTYKCNKTYNSLEEMVKDKNIDAVAIFTGAPDHVKHAVMCMKEGKHVISAVPAAVSMEQAEELLETVKKTGLTYMMAETSYYEQFMISVRKFYEQKKFGDIYYSESEYHHGGMEYSLWFDENKKPTWRWGLPPMLYPTHNLAFLTGITGERLTEVVCTGWKDDDPIIKGNTYNDNPFWNETAFFVTNKGNSHRASIYWRGAFAHTVGARWYGSKMSFFSTNPNGLEPIVVRQDHKATTDDAGFYVQAATLEKYDQPMWWKTDMLPEPMRHDTGHEGSHTFIAHEFISALVEGRSPDIDIYESLAYTVPGIIAHKSALAGGKPMKIPSFDRA